MTAPITPGFAGVGAPWTDRLREAAYTSPQGTRITFDFEDVSRDYTKRGTVFEFPGVNDAYVQETGHGPRRYPMRCFFSGDEHDLIATAFEAALLEPGIGRLEHPLYPPVDVVPFGDITRRDDLKSAANQTVLEVTFWTSVGAIYPLSQADPQSEILAAIAGFDVAAAQQFADSTSLASALDQASAKSTVRSFLKSVSASLDSVSQAVASVNGAFRDLQSEINFGLDVLVGQPLLLAQQIVNLTRAPARAVGGIRSRLDAYGRLASDIFGSKAGRPGDTLASGVALATRTQRIANDFHLADLHAMSTVAGSLTVVTGAPVGIDGTTIQGPLFSTKPEALTAIDIILAQLDALTEWRDGGIDALEAIGDVHGYQVDRGEAIKELQQAAALTAGFLVQISFTLAAERRIVLDRARTIVDLAAELYGSVDDRLDFLIATNGLTGSEILELPAGRTILYYPN